MAQRLRRASCMDRRLRERMIGRAYVRLHKPTLSQLEADDVEDIDAQTWRNTSAEDEVHPELFSDESTRVRLGFDPMPAE